ISSKTISSLSRQTKKRAVCGSMMALSSTSMPIGARTRNSYGWRLLVSLAELVRAGIDGIVRPKLSPVCRAPNLLQTYECPSGPAFDGGAAVVRQKARQFFDALNQLGNIGNEFHNPVPK